MIMNDRNKFINMIKKFDDDFAINDDFKEVVIKNLKSKGYKTYKEYCKMEGLPHIYVANIRISIIKNITLSTKESENPFIVFYKQNNEIQEALFNLLAKTEAALTYYNLYSEPLRDLKAKNTHKNISRKIQEVIEYMIDTDDEIKEYFDGTLPDNKKLSSRGVQTYDYLYNLKGSLNNNHYTKRQLYQNLLYEMNNILNTEEFNNKQISKEQIVKIVNLIISKYFNDNEKFTTKTNLKNFIAQKYIYETMAGIILTHGKK